MSSKIEYACKGKGGRYEILGLATGAGLTRGEDRLVYKDASTGRLFMRTEADFSERMERLKDDPPVVERQPDAYIVEAVDPNNGHLRRRGLHWHSVETLRDTRDFKEWIGENITKEQPLYTAPPELAELQATIDQLTVENEAVKFNLDKTDKRYLAAVAEIERLKGGQGGVQMAAVPVERCYDVRAKMIIAFNEARKNGGDLDDGLDAAYKSALRYSPSSMEDSQPAPVSVVLPTLISSEDGPHYSDNRASELGYLAGYNACLDNVKQLNQ